MRKYVEPNCIIISIAPITVICGSIQFDSIDFTEEFTVEDIETI